MLSFGSAWLSTSQRRVGCEVNLLLRLCSDLELRSINQILPYLDVSLEDEATSVMNGLSLTSLLVNSCLESPLHELVEGQTQYVIELSLALTQESISCHSSEKGGTFE